MTRRDFPRAEGYNMIWTGGKGRGQIGYISWVYGLRKRGDEGLECRAYDETLKMIRTYMLPFSRVKVQAVVFKSRGQRAVLSYFPQ